MSRMLSILMVFSVVLGLASSGYGIATSPARDGSMVAVHHHHADGADEALPASECNDCHERHMTANCAMSVSHCASMAGSYLVPVHALSWTKSAYLASAGDIGRGIEPEASAPPPRA